ncbi:hypothetical protein C8J27_10745 [Rhodobacter aestuarii]|uniref:Uncharacterized protein n=1 Tax=Rhodobacter aestuarii TaxID=453582 RepID=A0A1N7NW19_9RHOB|nr:hypothetical protein [Rhodobacter aestuarii]PTV94514.1 hypothetical protein C8J27_10745 [Rhodobacter aestuarii]SIT02524.1 hypothetical protein SAMN05421580_108182 [Rhodobacter aestuarii]
MRPGLILALCLAPVSAQAETLDTPVYAPMQPFVVRPLPADDGDAPPKPDRPECIAVDLAMRAAHAKAGQPLPGENPLRSTEAERQAAHPRVAELTPAAQDYVATLQQLQQGHEIGFRREAFALFVLHMTCIQPYAQPSADLP